MTEQKNWQSAINSQLSQRLIRPLIQPGIISFANATEIIQRSQRFSSRHPLLNNPRWSSLKHLEGEKVPIVHAQGSISREAEVQQTGLKRAKTPVVQAKRIIESKQAFESQNKLNYPASQPTYPTETSVSQSPTNNSSNVVIQRKLDPSAPQSQSQAISSSLTSSHSNTKESTSLDEEISSPAIPTSPVSNLAVPTSPLLPDTDTIFSQQQSNPLPLANSSSQNSSNSNFLSQDTDTKQLPSNNIELNRQHNQQQVSEEENSQFLSNFTNNISNGETAEVINTLPVVKSSKIIVAQQNNITQLGKNELEASSTAINSLLPVVETRPKLYAEKNNFTQFSKNQQFDYPEQNGKISSGTVESVIESNSRKTEEEKLIPKEVVQGRKASNYPHTITADKSSNIASELSYQKSNQSNTLPIVKSKLLTSSQNSSAEKLSSSQLQTKSVVVNPQQRKYPEIKTPLIFSKGVTGQQTQENNDKRAISQANIYPSVTNEFSKPRASETIVNQWLVNQNQQKHSDYQSQQNIDINAITNQVERRLKRRLIAESERRGRKCR